MKTWGKQSAARGLLAVVLSAASYTAGATVFLFEASLNQAQEVPAPVFVPGARGSGFLLFDDSDMSVEWLVTFAFLSGPPMEPGPGVGSAHVHMGSPGATGSIVFGLGTHTPIPFPGKPLGTFGNYFGDGVLLSMAEKDLLFAGDLYFNIHTALNSSGEIRGQILFNEVIVPLPPAVVLFLSGLGLVAIRYSRRA